MKYIRTIDGIYNAIKEFKIGDMIGVPYNGLVKIVARADTIKELCDAYVITSKQGHIYDTYGNYDYELKEVLPQAREECPDEDWNLYGCILVNGIIKQVAKLNDDKGELELL